MNIILDSRATVTYHTDAVALFARMTVQPNSIRKAAINAFIVGCVSDNNWAKIIAMWFLAAHDQQAADLNWISSSHTITRVNAPAWVTDNGYTSNGTTSYLNTNWNSSTQGGGLYERNNASFGCYLRTNIAENNWDMHDGGGIGAVNAIISRGATNLFSASINGSATDLAASTNTDSRGFFSANRSSSTTQTSYKNGVLQDTGTDTSRAPNSENSYLLCRNGLGTPSLFTNKQMAFAFFGSGSLDHLALYNRVQTYLTQIGAAV